MTSQGNERVLNDDYIVSLLLGLPLEAQRKMMEWYIPKINDRIYNIKNDTTHIITKTLRNFIFLDSNHKLYEGLKEEEIKKNYIPIFSADKLSKFLFKTLDVEFIAIKENFIICDLKDGSRFTTNEYESHIEAYFYLIRKISIYKEYGEKKYTFPMDKVFEMPYTI